MEDIRSGYSHLTQPGQLGRLSLPHRMLMGSMHLGIEGDRQMLERLIGFYAERVRGGAALIITGGVAVHPSGWEPHRFLASDPSHRQQLHRLVEAIHALGGRIAIQLFHAGRYARMQDLGYAPWAPSAVVSRLSGETPVAMEASQIDELVAAYREAAGFAAQAGFDGVEVMASEGYLLNSFVSPITNQRSDHYAGPEGGARLLIEIARAVRQGLGPSPALLYRVSGWDGMDRPCKPSMPEGLVARLTEAGVDAFNVGVGWHESRVPTVSQMVPQGAFGEIAGRVHQQTTVPVIGANRLASHEVANALIAAALMDFVAPARPWLADPAWALRAYDGLPMNPCIACNQACLDRSLAHPPQPISCTVNPRALRESSFPHRHPRARRSVAVVGAGPAGLEAARAAAEWGHQVTLFEASDDIGGQLRLAMRVPGKEEIAGTLAYYRQTLDRLGVATVFRATPDLGQLAEVHEAIIVATGVIPRGLAIAGADLAHVISYPLAFQNPSRLFGNIVIVGGGGIGLDLALFLAMPQGLALPKSPQFWDALPTGLPRDSSVHSIMVVTRGRAGRSIGRSTRWILRQVLRQVGVIVIENAEVVAIAESGVHINQEGEDQFLPADGVVLCNGQVANRPNLPARDLGTSISLIGGARDGSQLDMVRAISEGLGAADQLGHISSQVST